MADVSEKKSRPLRLVMIGFYSEKVSGSTLLFKQLYDDLQARGDLRVSLINTARDTSDEGRRRANVVAAVMVIRKLISLLGQSDVVSFQASRRAMVSFGPVIWIVARCYRKPLIVRLFGGELDDVYFGKTVLWRWVVRKTVFRSRLILLETKALVEAYQGLCAGAVRWYPNSRVRPSHNLQRTKRPCLRYVFLGRICRDKGIDVLLSAAKKCDDPIEVGLYGSLDDGYTEEVIRSSSDGRARYLGRLKMSEIIDRLHEWDALVLPTHYEGEGYPGVVIEAFMAGIPVIATQWKAVPEVVSAGGMLIPIKDVGALADAMNALHRDPVLYNRLSEEARRQASLYDAGHLNEQFLSWARLVASGNAVRLPCVSE